MVGCGCRGRALAAAVREDGHAVRGTSRRAEARSEIEAVGAEFHRGDPDRIGTLTYALDGATILAWLMGSARGTFEELAALHSTRLQMLLERTIDTSVRGVVYEAAGDIPADLLEAGAETVRRACRYSEIPHAILAADPAEPTMWLAEARAAVLGLLA